MYHHLKEGNILGLDQHVVTINVDEPQESNPLDDPLASLQKGWSIFSSFALQGAKIAVSGAETLGKTVTESVIKPTATAIRDPDFNKNMQSYVTTFSQKVSVYFNLGNRSWYQRI